MREALIFSTKNISVFGYNKVVKHLTSWPLNELVKLTMLWTTGPWATGAPVLYVITICWTYILNTYISCLAYKPSDTMFTKYYGVKVVICGKYRNLNKITKI